MLPIPIIDRPPASAELQRMRALQEEASRALEAANEECMSIRNQLAGRPGAGASSDPESLIRDVLDANPRDVPTIELLTVLDTRRAKLEAACKSVRFEIDRLEREAGRQVVRQHRPFLRALRLATLEAAEKLAVCLEAETALFKGLSAAGGEIDREPVVLCEGQLRTGADFAEQVAVQRKELQYDERLDSVELIQVRLLRDAMVGPAQVRAGSIVEVAGCVASACLHLGLAEPVDQAGRTSQSRASAAPDLVDLASRPSRHAQRAAAATGNLS